MIKVGWFFPWLLLGSWLPGVKRETIPLPEHNKEHEFSEWLRTPVTNQNRDFVNRRYGYFKTMDIPCNEAGKEDEWQITLTFVQRETAYCSIAAYLYLGSEEDWLAHKEVQSVEISRWGFSYRPENEYPLMCYPIGIMKAKNITLAKGYSYSDAWMAVGVYIDEDGKDANGNAYQGRFYHISFPLPYYLSTTYWIKNVNRRGQSYFIDRNRQHYMPRIVKNFGGRLWTYEEEAIRNYEYLNAELYQSKDRGTLNQSLVPLDFEVRYYDDKKRPYSLKNNGVTANFYILEGYQNFPFGKADYDAFTKQSCYKFSLKHDYYLKNWSNRFLFQEHFYVRKDGLEVYRENALPAGFSKNLYDETDYFILPPLKSDAAVKYHFRLDLLGCGPHKQINYQIDYYFTRSKNFFGHHTNSQYFVEEMPS